MPAYASAKPNATMAAVSNYDDTPGLKMVSSGANTTSKKPISRTNSPRLIFDAVL